MRARTHADLRTASGGAARRTFVRLVGIAVIGVAAVGVAGPTLHEPIPDVAPGSAPTIGGGRGGNPTAIVSGDKVLAKPALDTPPSNSGATGHAPVLGTKDFSADRQTAMHPDEQTGSDGTLHYVSVFNPDVLPFKRMSVFDAVADDYTLHVARTALADVAVGGTTDPATRDRFWADLQVQLQPGVDVPLPSVAPDMRILSYETKPAARLAFSKDGADNYFVRSDDATGTVHLVFYADADAGYFAPRLPDHSYRVRDVAARAPRELVPPIPDAVRRQAEITIAHLGIDGDMSLGVAFNKLVGYFRAFQPGEIEHPSGDIYRDLCDTQLGVCRHRAFAFAITANALGIPARFVENEAHAFAEVWLPDRGWQRIDLGGAALRMDVAGANDKTLHRPRAEDPFAKPPEYQNSYTQLEGDIRGLSSHQLADKHRSLDDAPASGDTFGGSGQSQSQNQTAHAPPDTPLPHAAPDPQKPTPHLAVTDAAASAYRGGHLHVEGLATVAGKPLADRVVDVFLAPAGAGGEHAIEIGSAKTGADGTFRVDLSVPAGLSLAAYEIYLSSIEDGRYNASLSD